MISDLEGLAKLLKLLRAEGVTSFAHDTLSIEMGDMPQVQSVFIPTGEQPQEIPTEAELDAMVNMPVGGLEDPFLTYNEQAPTE